MNRILTIAAASAFLALSGPAKAQDAKPDAGGMQMGAAGGPADKAYEESMQKMMKDMMSKPTGNPDKDFVMMMMPHHQGAIDMAEVELRFGHNTVLRRLAQAIIVEQGQEIAVMRQALATLPPVSSRTETPLHPPTPNKVIPL